MNGRIIGERELSMVNLENTGIVGLFRGFQDAQGAARSHQVSVRHSGFHSKKKIKEKLRYMSRRHHTAPLQRPSTHDPAPLSGGIGRDGVSLRTNNAVLRGQNATEQKLSLWFESNCKTHRSNYRTPKAGA